MDDDDKDLFKGPTDMVVPAGSQGMYPLTFSPSWIGSFTATLVLAIPATLETTTYKLIGHGVEPAAADHLVLRCTARGRKTMRVRVPCTAAEDVEYKVFTDCPYMSGEETLSVPARSIGTYTLSFAPAVSGVYTGTLTFSSTTGHYVWYTVEGFVAAAPQQETIEVSCPGASLAGTADVPQWVLCELILSGRTARPLIQLCAVQCGQQLWWRCPSQTRWMNQLC